MSDHPGAARPDADGRAGTLPAQAPVIEDWLVARIAARLEVAPETVDTEVPFAHLGLDSAAAVELSGELAEALGRPVDPTLVFEHVTIQALAAHLAAVLHGPTPRPGAAGRRRPGKDGAT